MTISVSQAAVPPAKKTRGGRKKAAGVAVARASPTQQ